MTITKSMTVRAPTLPTTAPATTGVFPVPVAGAPVADGFALAAVEFEGTAPPKGYVEALLFEFGFGNPVSEGDNAVVSSVGFREPETRGNSAGPPGVFEGSAPKARLEAPEPAAD
jgi:hypothetical protein